MSETAEKIALDSPDDLADSRVLDHVNYIVAGEDIYAVRTDGFEGEHYLERVDEIPEEHWERFNDE